MTGNEAGPGALEQCLADLASGHRDDPLLAAWLRRALPPAAGPRQRDRYTRIVELARAYALHASADAGAWPSPTDPPQAVDATWSSVQAVAIMRRTLTLVRLQAEQGESRHPSPDHPALRTELLASLEAETWGAFLMAFMLAELNGRLACGEIDRQQHALLRLMAPVAALGIGRQAVALVGEAIVGMGAAEGGEDRKLPQLLRDALGLAKLGAMPDVFVLDAMSPADLHDGLAALMGRTSACVRGLSEPRLVAAGRLAVGALERAALWLETGKDREVLQAGARRLALTLARGLQLALLCEHAQWMMDHGQDRRGFAAALRYSRLPVDQVHEVDLELDRALLRRPSAP